MPSSISPSFRNVVLRFHLNLISALSAALLFGAGALSARAQTTTFTCSTEGGSNCALQVGANQTTASTSSFTVPTAGTIQSITVELYGVWANGDTGYSMGAAEFLLTGPGGSFDLLGETGDTIDGDDNEDSGSGLHGLNIVLEDGQPGAPMACGGLCSSGESNNWPAGNGSSVGNAGTITDTVKPGSYFGYEPSNGSQAPPLGVLGDWPDTDGCNPDPILTGYNGAINCLNSGAAPPTLTSKFGTTTANGTWTLTVENVSGVTSAISITNWSVTITYASLVSTSTSISSNANPSNASNTVTFTASVSATSGTPTGTVTFTANSAPISGCTGKSLSGGQAACATTLSQGNNVIEASYTPGSGFGSSSSSMTELIEATPSQSGNKWCNSGQIVAPGNVAGIQYPSIINVSGYPNGSTVGGNLTVELLNATGPAGVNAYHLLVAPGGQNLDFFDSTFSFNQPSSPVNLTIFDSAGQTPSGGSPPSTGNYDPYDGNENGIANDGFAPSVAHSIDSSVPGIPGTINRAAPLGGTSDTNFQQSFNGASANGDWALYTYAGGGENETIESGWCITLDVNTGVATTTTVASNSNPQTTGQTVILTATVLASGSPVTSGTVTFLDNNAVPAGVSNNTVALNGSGQAAISTSSLTEGDHSFTATFNGTSNDNGSYGTFVQRINDATTLYANGATISHGPTCGATYCYCNGGLISTTASFKGAFTPNPSVIDVTGLPGTIDSVTLGLNQYSSASTILYSLESMVVSPTGADLDFFSNAGWSSGGGTASLGNYLFSDAAGSEISSSVSTLSPGTYQPTSFVEGDSANWPEPAQPYFSGYYTPPSAITYAGPRASGTFTNQFQNTNPDGNWTLYMTEDAPAGVASAANGWCVNFTENSVNASANENHVGSGTGNDFLQGETNAQLTTVVTAGNSTGPTGDPLGTNPLKVTDTLNAALTYESFSGSGWSCSASGQTVNCTDDNAVAEGASYPTLTLNVNVSPTASGSFGNSVGISGAGVAGTTSNTDTITIETPTTTSASNASVTFSSNAQNVTLTATVTSSGSPVNAGTVTFTVAGLGTPTTSGTVTNGLTSVSYALPAGAASGTYQITATYNPVAGFESSSDNTHNLTIEQQPAITSAANTTFATGAAGSFTVTTTGDPTPALSESGALPNGVSFTDNGNGTATLAGTPALGSAGSYPFTITASNGIGTNAMQSFALTVTPPPSYVVTTNGDDVTGTPSNCPIPSSGNTCTLRDALAAAAAAGSGVITFDGTAFSAGNSTAQNTIALTNGILTIPGDTSITGPTSGSGYALSNLVTVDGGGIAGVFGTESAGVTISQLAIQNGNSDFGGGIFSDGGTVTVANSTFTNNTAAEYGGAILSVGAITVTGSTFTGNSAQYGGGIIDYSGTTTITDSTFTNNSAAAEGGGFYNNDQATVNSSTFSGNSAAGDGGGIEFGGGANNMANSIVSGNSAPSDPDVNPFTDLGGNQVGAGTINLAPLANYGGPTQTMIPTPGSPAICAGLAANIPSGVTTDQRGLPNQNTTYPGYTLTTPCVDSGAVQTNYAMSFTAQPPATVNVGATIAPAPVVTLTESGNLASAAAGTVTMTDNSSVLSGTTSEGLLSGTATFTGLVLSSSATNDIFTASLALNSPLSITAQTTQGVTTVTPVPAVMQSPTPGAATILGTGIVKFQWSAGVGVTSYQVDIGTAGVASDNLYASGRLSGTTYQVKKIPANGVTVFVRLGSLINGKWQFEYYVYTESSTPTLATLTPSSGTLSPSQLFTWNNGAGPLDFIVQFGTIQEGSNNLFGSMYTTATSATVSIPSNGVTVYGTLSQRVNGTWVVSHYTFTEPGTPTLATLSVPGANTTTTPPTLLPTQQFTWSNGAGPVEYDLLLGTTGVGSTDLDNIEGTMSTSTTVSIPTNGVTVYATLRQLVNGTWQTTHYTFTEPTPPAG